MCCCPELEKADGASAPARPSVCLVAHFAYGLLTGRTTGHIGGVEKQTSLTARWLVDQGYEVSMLTWDEGQPADEVVGGIRVIKMCTRKAGVPGLRFLHPRWTSLNRAMRQADADVYYQNCAEYVTGQVALWCRRNHRGFVYSVASDPDCDPKLPKQTKRRERVLYRYGLRHADRIIVQTKHQRKMLDHGFGLEADVIPMPCPGPTERDGAPPDLSNRARGRVLWVARIAPVKRLEWLLDMAERAPDLTFEVLGPDDGSDYAASVTQRARSIPNVILSGPASRAHLDQRFRGGCVLCCTSSYEGFPNTFLEAWSHGLPVVSTVDPDGVIADRALGAVARDAGGLLASIRSLVDGPDQWRRASENGWRYYIEHHSVERVLPRFERVLLDAVKSTQHVRA